MQNNSVLIIGAEKGLGLGLAETWLSRGWEVFATHLPNGDIAQLNVLQKRHPDTLTIGSIDVTRAEQIPPLLAQMGGKAFDVIFLVAGIFGPLHQSVLQASDDEFQQIILTNTFGPARLARSLLPLLKAKATLAFMTSHRASIAAHTQQGIELELYRASKVALNMLARGIFLDIQEAGHTVLSIHPGWVATAMGTLEGTVEAEISVATSVQGMTEVVEQYRHANNHLFIDYKGECWPW